MDKALKAVAAGEFKQGCLRFLTEVATTHCEIIITKRGKPIARLIPMTTDHQREAELLAKLGHTKILVTDDELLKPAADVNDWNFTLADET